MRSGDDLDRLMAAWLDEGAIQLPDRVLDDVLDQLPQVRQVGRWPLLRLRRRRSLLFAVAGAAAVVAASVVFALALGIGLFATSIGNPPESRSAVPSAMPSTVPDLPGSADLVGGWYRMWPRPSVSVTLNVPDGWDAYERWAITVPGAKPGAMGLAFWDPVNLYRDPVSPGREPMEPAVGPTVEDLTEALVDGHEGVLVRLTVPTEPPIAVCEEFVLWYDVADRRSHCVEEAGAVVDVYVVDVRGERIVFTAVYDPGASPDQIALLRRTLDSIRFDASPSI